MRSAIPARILMTTDTVGGVWSYCLELVRGLGHHGIEVVLAAMGPLPSAEQMAAAGRIRGLRVEARPYQLEWMDDPWDDVERAADWLLELADGVEPDVVHLNGYVHGALPWRRPVLIVGHSCVSTWFEAVHGTLPPPLWDPYRRRVREGLQAADLVVSPSWAMLHGLERHYGVFRRGRAIANARDPAEWPIRPKEPFVLAAGRVWDEAENLSLLDAVAPQVDWPVLVAGEARRPGESGPVLRNVDMLGRLRPEVLARVMGRAAIYVLPARYEPFGLSVLEAALTGCALVLGDIPSMRELWSGAAVFVSPDDPAAIAATLTTLVSRAETRQQLAVLARRRALTYAPDVMVSAYLETYRGLGGVSAERTQARG